MAYSYRTNIKYAVSFQSMGRFCILNFAQFSQNFLFTVKYLLCEKLQQYVQCNSTSLCENLILQMKTRGVRSATTISRPSHILLIFSSEPPRNPRPSIIKYWWTAMIISCWNLQAHENDVKLYFGKT